MYFIWLPSSELAIQRVAKRVREGGHNIPDAVVRRRYARGLTNLFDLYIPIVTTVCVYDGASFPPIPIAEIESQKTGPVLQWSQQRARIDTSMADFLAASCSIHAE
jgi:predicted ABC-type ATPase